MSTIVVNYIKKCPKCGKYYSTVLSEDEYNYSVCLGPTLNECESCHHVFFDFDNREWIYLSKKEQLDYLAQANMKNPSYSMRLNSHAKKVRDIVIFIILFPVCLLMIFPVFGVISRFIWFSRYNKSYKRIISSNLTVKELDIFGEVQESIERTNISKYIELIDKNSDLVVSNSVLNDINHIVKK